MTPEDDKELWELLGKTSEPQVSPFFSRDVVRAVRSEPQRRAWLSWLSPRIVIPLASCAAVVIAAGIALQVPGVSRHERARNATLVRVDADDADVAADLDDLVGGDDDDTAAESTII